MQKTAGILLSIGSLLFLIAIMTPAVFNVFGAFDNPQLQIEYIENDFTGWAVWNIVYGGGSVIASIGLVLFAKQAQSVSNNKNIRIAGNLGGAMATLGAILYLIIALYRVVQSPEVVVNNMNINSWMYPIYTLFTQIALIIFGFVLLQSGYQKWLGWVVLVPGGILALVAYLVFGDVPPGVYYPILLVMGLTLLFKRSPLQQELSQTA